MSHVSAVESYTPMIQQYLAVKKEHPHSVLFFRLGDFYEMFFEDAERVSQLLELTLTSREAGRNQRVAMCGIPHHAAESYIARLLKLGERVAICEQVSDPTEAKGLVRREVVKLYTPGTVVADALLKGQENNYLVSLIGSRSIWGLAFMDLSTGEFKTTELQTEALLLTEIERLAPSEIVMPHDCQLPQSLELSLQRKRILVQREEWMFDARQGQQCLLEHYNLASLDGLGLRQKPQAITAAGAALQYARHTHGQQLSHLKVLTWHNAQQHMQLDVATQRNLELLYNNSSLLEQSQANTLWGVLHRTCTALGTRLLRTWLLQPLRDVNTIHKRLNAIEELLNLDTLTEWKENLRPLADLERLVARLESGSANGRDLQAMAQSLKWIPKLKKLCCAMANLLHQELLLHLPDCSQVVEAIENAIVEHPPFLVREGGVIKTGFNAELDELRQIKNNGKQWLAAMQERERQRSGIKTLKVKYNKVFGYHIEISKAQANNVPEDYMRKQTLANAERFITAELKEKEAMILGADEQMRQMEQRLFEELRVELCVFTPAVQQVASAVAVLDVLQSLADMAQSQKYCKPVVDESCTLKIEQGRHPVVEKIISQQSFVPNDLHMDTSEQQLALITGPNMAGKSTFIRQVALIVLLAQMGSYVPANAAHIGLVDRIFTRVGAADELARGQSTFMLEMTETANIINNASQRSLIVLDEVGRGTSTFDGVSIAWSLVEHLHNEIGAKTIFATHYHELTQLAEHLPRVFNLNVACEEWNNDIVFLHKIEQGAADRSYGLHVARLAGLPKNVLKRAQQILRQLEETSHKEQLQDLTRQGFQFDLFQEHCSAFEEWLKSLDLAQHTPLQLMTLLQEWQDKLR